MASPTSALAAYATYVKAIAAIAQRDKGEVVDTPKRHARRKPRREPSELEELRMLLGSANIAIPLADCGEAPFCRCRRISTRFGSGQ
jgi:hypothetical protein